MPVIRTSDPAYRDFLVNSAAYVVTARRQIGGGVEELTWQHADKVRRPNSPVDSAALTRTIGRSPTWLQRPLEEYNTWRERWWREAIQNAVDAGSTRIDLAVVEDPEMPGVNRVSCQDNGGGMAVDTLLNVFLMLGASQKAEGSTGGFGKAKELLLLPWLQWEIHSRDFLIQGRGDSHTDPQPAAPLAGTQLTVWMDQARSTSIEYAKSYLSKCYLPNVRFRCNGSVERSDRAAPGELINHGELRSNTVNVVGQVRYNEKAAGTAGSIWVRANGLWMFDAYLSDGDQIPGKVTIELLGADTRHVLLVNRDGFRDDDLREGLEVLAQTIARDSMSALDRKEGIRTLFYAGERGTIEGSETFAAGLLSKLPTVTPKTVIRAAEEVGLSSGIGVERHVAETLEDQPVMAEEDRAVLRAEAEAAGATAFVETERPLEPVSTLVEQQLAVATVKTQDQLQNALRFVANSPDVLVLQNVKGVTIRGEQAVGRERLPASLRSFEPGYMTDANKKLLRLWLEMCRFVLIAKNADYVEFGVGWIFDEKTLAACAHEVNERTGEAQAWLLVNPVRIFRDDNGKVKFKPALSFGDDATLAFMFSRAVHEVTHLADGISQHYDKYASALTANFGRVAHRWADVRKIRKAVAAAFAEERRAAGPREPKRAPLAPVPDVSTLVERPVLPYPAQAYGEQCTAAAAAVAEAILPGADQRNNQFYELLTAEILWSLAPQSYEGVAVARPRLNARLREISVDWRALIVNCAALVRAGMAQGDQDAARELQAAVRSFMANEGEAATIPKVVHIQRALDDLHTIYADLLENAHNFDGILNDGWSEWAWADEAAEKTWAARRDARSAYNDRVVAIMSAGSTAGRLPSFLANKSKATRFAWRELAGDVGYDRVARSVRSQFGNDDGLEVAAALRTSLQSLVERMLVPGYSRANVVELVNAHRNWRVDAADVEAMADYVERAVRRA